MKAIIFKENSAFSLMHLINRNLKANFENSLVIPKIVEKPLSRFDNFVTPNGGQTWEEETLLKKKGIGYYLMNPHDIFIVRSNYE